MFGHLKKKLNNSNLIEEPLRFQSNLSKGLMGKEDNLRQKRNRDNEDNNNNNSL